MGINEYSAYDVINTLNKEHLATIIKVLGEEKDGKNVCIRPHFNVFINITDSQRVKNPL